MRKRVLIFGHNYATQFIDVYNQYASIFDKNKYIVTVAYLTGKPDEQVKNRTLAEQILFLDFSKKQIRNLKLSAIRKLLQLTRKNQFDIVICHRYKPSYIMLWVAQFCKISALICVMHELNTMRAKARQWLVKLLARRNTIFAGVSNAVRNDIQKNLPSMPVVTLYNMIDIEQTEPCLVSKNKAREFFNLNSEDFVFGNLARLVYNKDQHSLIAAFAKIKPQCPKMKLLIVGVGKLEAELKQQVKNLGLTNDILFTGYVTQAQQYMRAFNCFVLSSVQEAFGRVLLEAMIAKVPIIATAVNGIPEVMAETGILIQPRNVDELAKAMQTMYQLSEEQQAKQGDIAYAHASNHFSIPAFKNQFWDLPLLKTLRT